ncbi:hypothetical protein FGIG_00215 [Fasciola gigantica]|uniref:Uncharacterized protein n=1 Tax=Fasciola gigantica TaxID=46835 RepID=A0A504YKW3_FASGI|nr:hypothetical protein FGIG_00215 [Fasciola gigantica]
MEHWFHHNFHSCNREISGISSRPQSAISSHTMTCPPWGTLDQGKLTGERPKTAARGVSREGAIYALREGSAMADRMGLKQTSGAQFANVDPVELNEIRANAIHSSDEQPARHGPKARLDGLEYAMNGRGTLTTGLIPATRALSETIAAPRLKGDAYEIAMANNGDGSKLLLSNWRLKPDQQPPVRPIPNSRNIRDRSRGAEARSCLNPTRPKWSGKVHWKRRSPAPVHSTF